jgi:hypothetical protein
LRSTLFRGHFWRALWTAEKPKKRDLTFASFAIFKKPTGIFSTL